MAKMKIARGDNKRNKKEETLGWMDYGIKNKSNFWWSKHDDGN